MILLKVEKSNFYIREILRHLLEGEVQSTNDIAKWINLSEKATRNKISAVDFFLKEEGLGSIERKSRIGVWLNATNEQKEKYLI